MKQILATTSHVFPDV